jgi:hypothetical protein
MSGHSYSRIEALRIAAQMDRRAENKAREIYREEMAEARACGFEVMSFDVWSGKSDPKAEAQDRMATRAFYESYDRDLY